MREAGSASGDLERGRDASARRAWRDAHELLSGADRETRLDAEDLELLATSAYMLGRDDDYVAALERAHRRHLAADRALRAVRCAFWIGVNLLLRGEQGRAQGWFRRARRLVEREGVDCVERGFLLLAVMFEREAAADPVGAIAAAAAATASGERFGDADLFALAAQDQGNLLIKQGRVAEGLGLLDEAMVAVTAGELSPIVNGFVYCGVIAGCHAAYEPRRAQEWTVALTRWCEQQPDMVSFTGTCLVHRAEIMQLHGAWPEALEEARRAQGRCARAGNRSAAAEAVYRQGEIHRLRGAFSAAEHAYAGAHKGGYEPQPGLALLRLAQGDAAAAAAAVRRLVGETGQAGRRAALLPAHVEIMLAVGEPAEARTACHELGRLAARWASPVVDAVVAQARGAIAVADEDFRAALVELRAAGDAWRELGAPYEAARVRSLVGQACRGLGDEEGAALELAAAREAFAELGAAPDLARVESIVHSPGGEGAHGLTGRELQVLRLVAAGNGNKAIASELHLSEHTVARHLQNIFAKLGVSSRTAASAYALTRRLL